METLILVVHVLVALSIIGLVLLQHGKGADVGAAFGGGASGSLFGASGSANFLSRTTAILAAVFFATSLGLTWYSSHKKRAGGRDEQSDNDIRTSDVACCAGPEFPCPGYGQNTGNTEVTVLT